MSAPWDGIERRKAPLQCQQQILDRLTKIEVEFVLFRDLLKDIQCAVSGNGQDGLLIRHDRVERVVHTVCWALGVVYVAVIGMLVKRWIG